MLHAPRRHFWPPNLSCLIASQCSSALAGHGVRVAFNGEVAWMQPLLELKVHERPLLPSAVVNGIDRGAASE